MNYNAAQDTAKLKKSILEFVRKEVIAFTEATGLAPHEIRIDFIDISTRNKKQMAVSDVRVAFAI